MRILWTIAGFLSFALGAIGAFLPLLPTVPFMLLAAFCFARGSDRFHRWLMAHPRFGPAIRDWQENGAISPGGKRAAMIAIGLTFGISLLIGLAPMILAIQAVVLGCVVAFILTRPSGPQVSGRS
ncbi:MAG: YbaN family protein [Pseudomonadota bacterium]